MCQPRLIPTVEGQKICSSMGQMGGQIILSQYYWNLHLSSYIIAYNESQNVESIIWKFEDRKIKSLMSTQNYYGRGHLKFSSFIAF